MAYIKRNGGASEKVKKGELHSFKKNKLLVINFFERGAHYPFYLLVCVSRSKTFAMSFKNEWQFPYADYEKKSLRPRN